MIAHLLLVLWQVCSCFRTHWDIMTCLRGAWGSWSPAWRVCKQQSCPTRQLRRRRTRAWASGPNRPRWPPTPTPGTRGPCFTTTTRCDNGSLATATASRSSADIQSENYRKPTCRVNVWCTSETFTHNIYLVESHTSFCLSRPLSCNLFSSMQFIIIKFLFTTTLTVIHNSEWVIQFDFLGLSCGLP